jgi:putative iron-only hydrogenase system regulator
MEKRLGIVSLLVENSDSVPAVNKILSNAGHLIHGRMGIPFHDKNIRLISLIVEGTTDEIGALTGPLGRLPGVQVKSVLTHYREAPHDDTNPK